MDLSMVLTLGEKIYKSFGELFYNFAYVPIGDLIPWFFKPRWFTGMPLPDWLDIPLPGFVETIAELTFLEFSIGSVVGLVLFAIVFAIVKWLLDILPFS